MGKIEDIANIVNQERAKVGLPPVSMDGQLCGAAQVRAREQERSFSHTRPDGRDCFSVFAENGINASYRGENVGMGGVCSAADMMKLWMSSDGHKKNILDKKFTKIGVGYHENGKYGYWAQLFY